MDQLVKSNNSMNGRIFAFNVKLGLDALANILPDVKAKVQIPGSYSIQQLFVDSTTANLDIFDVKESSLCGFSQDPVLAAEQKSYLINYLNLHINVLQNEWRDIIGHTIIVPDPAVANPTAPTFLQRRFNSKHCHSMDHRMHQSLNMHGTATGSSLGQMIMVISNANFWIAFIVPRLKFVNASSFSTVNNVLQWFKNQCNTSTPPTDVAWSLSGADPRSSLSWTNTDSTSASLTWTFDNCVQEGLTNSARYSVSVQINVTMNTGSNTITITSTDNVTQKSYSYVNSVVYHCDYRYQLHSRRIYNYTTAAPTADVSVSVEESVNWWNSGRQNTISDQYQNDLKNAFDQMKLSDKIQAALNTQFVLSGGGTFFMKNPSFTNAGDLMTELPCETVFSAILRWSHM
ncbi:hypothetical protein CPB86DRAFT_816769 [Serendipita vermifera]|nr:hypothetical protein CPB86DRAFT_816769 [Serendipita vermifera]